MRKLVVPGLLVLFCVIAGLGVFLGPDHSDLLPLAWLSGFMVLSFTVSYHAYFSRSRFELFPFFVLGVLLLNFFVQLTGGAHSPLWPAYFVFASVIAVIAPLGRTLATSGLILGIEAANLFLSGKTDPERWPVYAGSALSLVIVPAVISHIIRRTRGEKEQVEHKLEKLIEHADAINPLAETDTLEALTDQGRLAANVNAARIQENAFSGLIDMIYGFVPAHAYALFLKEREHFVLRASRCDDNSRALAPFGEILRPDRDNGIITGCAEYRQPQYLSNADLSGGMLGYYTRPMPVKSILAIPITEHGEIIGVLVVDSLEAGAFSPDTQDLLNRFSPFFIQIIEKIRAYHDLNLRATTFGAMHKMSAVLNSSLDLSDILERLAGEIHSITPYDFCVFALYDEKNRTISLVHQSGEAALTSPSDSLLRKITAAVTPFGNADPPAGPETTFPLEQGTLVNQMLTQWEQRQTAPYHFSDFGDREPNALISSTAGLNRQLGSLSCWPLATGEKFIGAFFLGSLRPSAFSEFHLSFFETLMNQVAVVMDNAILHRQISDLARTDGLTGLLNHRTFMEKIAEEYKRLDREPRPFSILLMDIDKFKGVNDKYGHPIGDVAIKTVAKVLKETGRASDFVARYGGEEFAVGMVDTSSEGALKTAERIRSIIEKTLVTRVSDGELRVTVSIGVSTFPEDTRKPFDLVTFADNALYQAKRSGRNRVCLHRDIKPSEAAPAKH